MDMKTKEAYESPRIEIVEVQTEGIVCNSGGLRRLMYIVAVDDIVNGTDVRGWNQWDD